MSTTIQQTNNTINTTTNQTTIIYDIEQFKSQFDSFLLNSKYVTTMMYVVKEKKIYIEWTGSRNKDYKYFQEAFLKWFYDGNVDDINFEKDKHGLLMQIKLLV